MQLEKNVHIQLFDEVGMVSERIVKQTAEFYNGPKDKHKGPIRIMFTIENNQDANDAIDYLKKLALDAPIKKTLTPGRKKTSNNKGKLDNSLEVLLEEAIKAAGNNQDKFIKYMRDHDFVFLDSQNLKLNIPETYNVKDRYIQNYQWLIRRSRVAKDPRNDRYDPQLFIGISILGQRVSKMAIYLYSEFIGMKRIAIPKDNPIDFKKTNLIKYPHWMHEDERFKWGIQHRELLNNPKKKQSKFYLRWAKDVKVGKEMKLIKK